MTDLLGLYRTMARIRAFEVFSRRLIAWGRLSGTLHLSIGQEAVAAGVCSALTRNDRMTTTHRGHGHTLAKGADPRRMFAEILGRASGYCRGRSGSMHIADPETGNLGANAIVGAGIPIALGAALAARARGEGEVAVAFFGEGATAEGVLFESLNIAALWKLPILFICENNHYAELTPADELLSASPVHGIAQPFGIPTGAVDGNDVEAVASAAAHAVDRARGGGGPAFLEYDTYRLAGHYEGDPMKYRDKAEADRWAERDPLRLARERLIERGVSVVEIDRTDEDAEREMEEALAWAESEPLATSMSIVADVYGPDLAKRFGLA